jgi:hypothetical protein
MADIKTYEEGSAEDIKIRGLTNQMITVLQHTALKHNVDIVFGRDASAQAWQYADRFTEEIAKEEANLAAATESGDMVAYANAQAAIYDYTSALSRYEDIGKEFGQTEFGSQNPSMIAGVLPQGQLGNAPGTEYLAGGKGGTWQQVIGWDRPVEEQRAQQAMSLKNAAKLNSGTKASEIKTAAATVESRTDADDTTKAKHIRTTQQCYLLYNMDAFTCHHRELIGKGEADTCYEAPDGKGNLQTQGYWSTMFKYQRMLLLAEEGSTSTAINQLYQCPGNEAFSKVTTSEYAHLQPLLKIYKVDPVNNNLIEMEFGTKTSTDGIASQLMVSGAVGTDKLDWARGTASGIKSFDWKYLGTDPFTATRDIEATLKLRLQHFSELSKVRTSEIYRTAGTTSTTAKYRYLDLILQPDCRDSQNDDDDSTNRRVYNPPGGVFAPECYEIRVDVGYHNDSWASIPEALRDSLPCQRQSLYLTLVDHKFDFKNDGTLDLTISYRGRLGSVMRDKKFNVLMPGGGFAEVEFRNPDDKSIREEILDIEHKIVTERAKQAGTQDSALLKKYERFRRVFFADMKQFMYNGIISKMDECRWIHEHEVPAADWQTFSLWQDLDSPETLPEPLSCTDVKVKAREKSDDLLNGHVEGKDGEPADTSGVQKKQNVTTATNYSEGDQKIHWCYLGDLIAAVLDNVLGDNVVLAGFAEAELWPNAPWPFSQRSKTARTPGTTKLPASQRMEQIVKNFHIMLGNIDMKLIRPNNNVVEFTTNLAHIAVSMETFRSFWTEKVLTKDILFYSLFDFLDDLIQDLVSDAVSSECFGGLLAHPVRAHAALISTSTPMNTSGSTPIIQKNPTLGYNEVHAELSTPTNPAFRTKTTSPEAQKDSQSTAKQYLILQVSDIAPQDLHGVYDMNKLERGDSRAGIASDDRTKGIYHFSYGADRGLLKSVEFNKTDQEFLPEARYASEGGMVLNQLANVTIFCKYYGDWRLPPSY